MGHRARHAEGLLAHRGRVAELRSVRALASDLARPRPEGHASYSWLGALLRNAALYPAVLVHAFGVVFRNLMKSEN